jgi:hypothetical protein
MIDYHFHHEMGYLVSARKATMKALFRGMFEGMADTIVHSDSLI